MDLGRTRIVTDCADRVEPSELSPSTHEFWRRLRRAGGLLAVAAAAHVWVVPALNSSGKADGSAPRSALRDVMAIRPTVAALDAAAATAPPAVKIRTQFVTAGIAAAPADASDLPTDRPPRAGLRVVGTSGAGRPDPAAVRASASLEGAAIAATAPSLPLRDRASSERAIDATSSPVLSESLAPRAPVARISEAAVHRAEEHAAAPAAAAEVSAVAIDRAAAAKREEEIVRQVLRDYARAFERLDVQAAKALWPTVDDRALQRAFQQLDAQQVRFASCGVAVTGRDANARCRGEATYRPKVGSRVLRLTAREWTFNLSRDNDRWQIVNATLQ